MLSLYIFIIAPMGTYVGNVYWIFNAGKIVC